MVTLNLSKWWSVIAGAVISVAAAALPVIQGALSAHPTIFAVISSLLMIFAHQFGLSTGAATVPAADMTSGSATVTRSTRIIG